MQLIQLQSFTHEKNDAADSTAYFAANVDICFLHKTEKTTI